MIFELVPSIFRGKQRFGQCSISNFVFNQFILVYNFKTGIDANRTSNQLNQLKNQLSSSKKSSKKKSTQMTSELDEERTSQLVSELLRNIKEKTRELESMNQNLKSHSSSSNCSLNNPSDNNLKIKPETPLQINKTNNENLSRNSSSEGKLTQLSPTGIEGGQQCLKKTRVQTKTSRAPKLNPNILGLNQNGSTLSESNAKWYGQENISMRLEYSNENSIERRGDENKSRLVKVPNGWQRFIETDELSNKTVIYKSPSGFKFQSISEIREYLLSSNTCKCGLECPLNIYETFNFNASVESLSLSDLSNIQPRQGLCCFHRGKVMSENDDSNSSECRKRLASETENGEEEMVNNTKKMLSESNRLNESRYDFINEIGLANQNNNNMSNILDGLSFFDDDPKHNRTQNEDFFDDEELIDDKDKISLNNQINNNSNSYMINNELLSRYRDFDPVNDRGLNADNVKHLNMGLPKIGENLVMSNDLMLNSNRNPLVVTNLQNTSAIYDNSLKDTKHSQMNFYNVTDKSNFRISM